MADNTLVVGDVNLAVYGYMAGYPILGVQRQPDGYTASSFPYKMHRRCRQSSTIPRLWSHSSSSCQLSSTCTHYGRRRNRGPRLT